MNTCSLIVDSLAPLHTLVHNSAGLLKPVSVSHMFGNWAMGNKTLKPLLLLGATAICWSICLHTNDIDF
jgi:hypothetical protein